MRRNFSGSTSRRNFKSFFIISPAFLPSPPPRDLWVNFSCEVNERRMRSISALAVKIPLKTGKEISLISRWHNLGALKKLSESGWREQIKTFLFVAFINLLLGAFRGSKKLTWSEKFDCEMSGKFYATFSLAKVFSRMKFNCKYEICITRRCYNSFS